MPRDTCPRRAYAVYSNGFLLFVQQSNSWRKGSIRPYAIRVYAQYSMRRIEHVSLLFR
jgi:hypothetical protein